MQAEAVATQAGIGPRLRLAAERYRSAALMAGSRLAAVAAQFAVQAAVGALGGAAALGILQLFQSWTSIGGEIAARGLPTRAMRDSSVDFANGDSAAVQRRLKRFARLIARGWIVAGLAIGLALKDSLGNFAAGVMLVFFRPFKKGDFVEVAGVAGTVDEVRIFSTVLTTPDNKQIIIPNGQVGADSIINYSAKEERRVDMVFGVSYDDDLKVARKVLTELCANHPLVLEDPATKIFVTNLGESSVDFAVRPWAKTADYWTVYGDLLEQGKLALEEAGCSIPYPQSDLHLHPTNPLSKMFKD